MRSQTTLVRELDAYLDRARTRLSAELSTPTLTTWCGRHWQEAVNAFRAHGRSEVWEERLAELPDVPGARLEAGACVRLVPPDPLAARDLEILRSALSGLQPWRKGPFELFGVEIDAEWRADLKWQRVSRHVSPLSGRRVLDVGCGNGYYAWRMIAAGARLVVGLDPGQLAITQFRALERYQPDAPIVLLPLGSEAIDTELEAFDSVFSMGVLYHRRQPGRHLAELRRALRSGGEVVLETLVIEGIDGQILRPPDRYAGMRNVWSLTSPATILRWLSAAGFTNARCVDVTRTTTAEQRTTPWMTFNSLVDSLDPADPGRTVEGYPAPTRAVFVAERA